MEYREVVDVIGRVFRSVENRSDALFEATADPDLELHWPPSLPYGGVARLGDPQRRGWGAHWDPFQPTEEERSLEPRIVAVSKSEAVVLWRQKGLSPEGERINTPVLGLYRISNGKLLRGQMFYFEPELAAEFLSKAQRSVAKPTRRSGL